MEQNFGQLLEKLGKELEAASSEPNAVNRYLACIRVAESAIAQMKDTVAVRGFDSPEAEIQHFKYGAPAVYSQLFYYLSLQRIEADRGFSDPEDFRSLLSRNKEVVDKFFHENEAITRYYNLGETHLDHHLFLRRPGGWWPVSMPGLFIPEDFAFGTYLLGWIKAYDRLRRWIKEEMDPQERIKPSLTVRWTGTRIDAILLFTALHLLGVFNHGKIAIKDLMAWVEEVLHVKVGQFHAATDDKASTKDPVEFFKRLLAVMEKKFDGMI